jgi:acetyltransferase-like isoleucine patch superfamily enzyme
MGLMSKIRRGEGPVFGTVKAVAKAVLNFHIPAGGPLRYVFGGLYPVHVFVREMGIWAARFFWYEPLFRSQCESVGKRFRMEKLPYILGRGRIVIGSGVRLSGKSSIGWGNRASGDVLPELVIGDDSFVGHECSFAVARSIRLGRHVLLAGGVRVYDYDGHPVDAGRRRAGEPNPPEQIRPVVIGDDVWVGTGAMILKGVTVGDRSVIAARSVVSSDVPADVVVAGNPARVVKRLGAEKGAGDMSEPRGVALDSPSGSSTKNNLAAVGVRDIAVAPSGTEGRPG